MFISTFGYENVWFHPRVIPRSKPAENTSCSKITDTTSIAIDLSQALRGNCRAPFLVINEVGASLPSSSQASFRLVCRGNSGRPR